MRTQKVGNMTQVDSRAGDSPVFEADRERLLGLAYRMVGSFSEAEDIVQETYLRFHQQPRQSIQNPSAWLTTVATRACLDHLRLAYRAREQYSGDWLPEPVSLHNEPEQDQALAQSLSMAFLHLMERLNPRERAVFILRQAFDWPYRSIANTLGVSEPACRQLFRRGQDKLGGREVECHLPCADMSLLREFMATCTSGDFAALTNRLARDVTVYSDSNGRVGALRHAITGVDRVAHFLFRLVRRGHDGQHIELATLNGEPGLVVHERGHPVTALVFSFRQGKLWRLYSVRNPDKLRRLSR